MDDVKIKTEKLVEDQRFEINAQANALAEERAKNAQLQNQNAQMQAQIDTLMAQMQDIMARQAQPQHRLY